MIWSLAQYREGLIRDCRRLARTFAVVDSFYEACQEDLARAGGSLVQAQRRFSSHALVLGQARHDDELVLRAGLHRLLLLYAFRLEIPFEFDEDPDSESGSE